MVEPLMHSMPPADELSRGLVCAPPFGQMTPAHVAWFLDATAPVHFAAGEQVLTPDSGPIDALLCICKGSITGRLGMAAMAGQFEY